MVGDDFDVRFFLISKIKKLQNKKILDLGGGDITIYPSLKNILLEINRILKPKEVLLITTPNNSYYESSKLTYD